MALTLSLAIKTHMIVLQAQHWVKSASQKIIGERVGKMRDSTYPTLISIAAAYQYKTSSFVRAQTMWQFELSRCTSPISLPLPATPCYTVSSAQHMAFKKIGKIGFQLQLTFESIRVSSVQLNRSFYTRNPFI